MAWSPLPNFLQFRLFCALLSLLIPTVTAVNISRCYKDTVCFYNRCDGKASDTDLRLFNYTQKTSVNLSSCEVILQMKKLAPKQLVLWLRLLRNLTEQSDISFKIFEMSFEFYGNEAIEGKNFTITRDKISLITGEYNLRVEVMTKFEDLLLPGIEAPFHSIEIKFEEVQLKMIFSVNEANEVNEAFRKTLTCSTKGFTDIDKVLSKAGDEYEFKPVDFAESRLSCPKGFNLSAAKGGKAKPIPEIYCENNQWQSDFFNTSDHPIWEEFLDSSGVIRESDGDQHKLTIVDELAIGCVRMQCSTCVNLPDPIENCEKCVSPKLLNATSNLHCAYIECESGYGFSFNGFSLNDISPMCISRNWKYKSLYKPMPIRRLTCAPIHGTKFAELPKTDKAPNGDAQIAGETTVEPTTRKHRLRVNGYKPEKNSAGDWLKKNWISSILVPLIILGGVTGCVIFLVCMLKTKDEQELLLREERRREQEEVNEFSGRERTNSSRSDSSLV